jgi:hypothetical protein
VTVPIAEYEKLRQAGERISLTVVDRLVVSGAFREQGLAITFSGRSTGSLPSVPVLSDSEGLSLHGCAGAGLLARRESGDFALTPIAQSFDVRCRVDVTGSDRLELRVPRSVLFVDASVSDGEFVVGEGTGDGERTFMVVRRTAGSAENQTPTASGKYRITLLPDETRFEYDISAHNPNRGRRAFDVVLASGEHVQKVDAKTSYEVVGTRTRFELPPGDTSLVLSGTLSGSSFAPPVEASLHQIVVESHPLLRPVVTGGGRRVSAAETGIATQFRGGRGFLLGKGEKLTWNVTQLGTLSGPSYTLRLVRHTFFVPSDGSVVGESSLSLDNQGASDLALPTTPQPTFASVRGEPVLLTRDAEGDLWLPLPVGPQEVLLQHRQSFARTLGIVVSSLSVPRVSAPATGTLVELRYARDWLPVYESFAGDRNLLLPGAVPCLWALLVGLATERVLAGLALALRRRVILAGICTAAALVSDAGLLGFLAADAIVALTWLVHRVRSRRWSFLKIAGAFVLAGIASILMAAGLLLSSYRPRPSSGAGGLAASSLDEESGKEIEVNRMMQRAQSLRPTAHAETAPQNTPPPSAAGLRNYQGVPARLELPPGVHQSWLSREMPSDPKATVRVLLVSSAVAALFRALPLATALLLLVVWRAPLISAWSAQRLAHP